VIIGHRDVQVTVIIGTGHCGVHVTIIMIYRSL
jgi:hypothetical protein